MKTRTKGNETESAYCLKSEAMASILLGGCDHEHVVRNSTIYTPEGYTPFIIPDTPVKTCTKPAAVYYKNSIVLCGGSGDDGLVTPCYRYLMGSSEWTEMPALLEHRELFTMNVVGEFIAVIGGFKAGTDVVVEVFMNGSWVNGPYLKSIHNLVHHASVSLGQNKVIVIGGFLNGRPTNLVQAVDVNNMECSMLASLNANRYSHSAAEMVWGGEQYIVVAGGFESYHVTNTVEYMLACDIEDPNSVWLQLNPMNIRRYNFGLTVFGRQLAAFGGQPTINSEQIEVYNEVTETWELTGQNILLHDRHFFASLSVPGSVFPQLPVIDWPEPVETTPPYEEYIGYKYK